MSTITDTVTACSAAATAIIAFAAATIALSQLFSGRREARLGIAKTIYKDYLALAFANPEFSSAGYPVDKPPSAVFKKDSPGKYEQYEYFVAYLLYGAEEIICLTKNEVGWRETLIDQLRYHGAYIESEDFPNLHYSPILLGLTKAALEKYRMDKPETRA
jgi:hypothetical protein